MSKDMERKIILIMLLYLVFLGLSGCMTTPKANTKNTEQAVFIFAENIAQSFEKTLNQLSKGIDAYQNELLASLKDMNASTSDNMVMEEISKSQNQLTKEIRSLYKKNEEIFSKIKSSDGLIKFP